MRYILHLLILSTLLSACAGSMYGVPQERWDRMSEQERIEAMRIYEREEQARRRAEEERARRAEAEREIERARRAEEERLRRERIEAIHRGEGAYGQLIRVRLQGGRMRIGARHHRYQPVTFTIAEGETVELPVTDLQGRETPLRVTYGGGALSLEGIRVPYERAWGKGTLYTDTSTSGALQLQGVDLSIEIVSRTPRRDRDLPRIVMIPEEEPPRPPVVIVQEEKPKPPVVIVQKERPQPPVVIVQEEKSRPPVAERAPAGVEVEFLSAEIKMKGRRYEIRPFSVRLSEGEIREVAIDVQGKTHPVTLAYIGGELFIDGNPQNGKSDIRLPFEKGWRKGMTYTVQTKGRLKLERGEVRVTAAERR